MDPDADGPVAPAKEIDAESHEKASSRNSTVPDTMTTSPATGPETPTKAVALETAQLAMDDVQDGPEPVQSPPEAAIEPEAEDLHSSTKSSINSSQSVPQIVTSPELQNSLESAPDATSQSTSSQLWAPANENTLQTANRAIHDLERKLSINSTSSNTTHVSLAGSVVMDPAMAGVGKSRVESTVLNYLKDTTFDANSLFDERQSRFVTKFNKEYSSSPSSSPALAPAPAPAALESPQVPSMSSPSGEDSALSTENLHLLPSNADTTLTMSPETASQTTPTSSKAWQSPLATPTGSPRKSIATSPGTSPRKSNTKSSPNRSPIRSPNRSPRSPQRRKVHNIDGASYLSKDDIHLKHMQHESATLDNNSEVGSISSSLGDAEFLHPRVDIESFDDLHDDDEFYDEDADMLDSADDMLMPPSPPRSPPKEIDPDMLYGLYDFNGPDPSHCTLTRNEPVVLVNDQDNYWWLIRKLTKDEKIAHRLKHKGASGHNIDSRTGEYLDRDFDMTSEYTELDDERISTDEEDGKTGFVPAECLETFGERLARLNCYKNEELERSGASLEASKPATKSQSGKSVMFDVAETPRLEQDLSEDDESDQEFPSEFYDHKHIASTLLKPPGGIGNNEEDKASEVLSDQYPANVELIVKKKKSSASTSDVPVTAIKSRLVDSSSSLITPLRGVHSEDNLPHQLESLSRLGKQDAWTSLEKPVTLNYDDVSIGSFSPDTPSSEMARNRSPRDPILVSTPIEPDVSSDENEDTEEIHSPESLIRRSLILDRLNQVTSDIQQLQLNDYEAFNEQDENGLLKWHSKQTQVNNATTVVSDDENEEVQLSSFNPYAQTGRVSPESPVRSTRSTPSNRSYPQFDSESHDEEQGNAEKDEDDFDECGLNGVTESPNSVEVITPLTLTNSLTSGVKPAKVTPSVCDEEPSRAVISSIHSSLSLELEKQQEYSLEQGRSSDNKTPSPSHSSEITSSIKNSPAIVSGSTKDLTPLVVESPTHVSISGSPESWKELTPVNVSQNNTPSAGESTDVLENSPESISGPGPESRADSETENEPLAAIDSTLDSLMFIDTSTDSTGVVTKPSIDPVAFEHLMAEDERINKRMSLSDKRKSKPVHDMFVPVLDKFDDLAKKLAELDDLL